MMDASEAAGLAVGMFWFAPKKARREAGIVERFAEVCSRCVGRSVGEKQVLP